MSLSKVRRIEDKNHRRDSFDNRICDDLSEVILKYLSIEDKLRMESVSKQFRRTVFCKGVTLYIVRTNVKHLEVLLKKLPSITSIIFCLDNERQLMNESIEMIIKYCNNLTEFDSKLLYFVDEDIQMKFFDKFGHKLKSIQIIDNHWKWCLDQTPNIEKLFYYSENQDFPDIQFKRLKRFNVDLKLNMDLTQFNVFIERNAETITHLNINWFPDFDFENDEQSMVVFTQMLTIISKLKNLIHLEIHSELENYFENTLNLPLNHNSFIEYLSQIAVNCNQLKSLSIDYELELIDGQNAEQFLPLKQFKGLKRLELNFVKQSNLLSNYLSNNGFFPFITLSKSVTHLTHISLFFWGNSIEWKGFSDTIFTNIDINYPKLQSICIGEKVNVSEETVLMMSRLPRLKSIDLLLSQTQNKTEIRSQLAQNCKILRKISLIDI